jgi:hypothetical protein
MGGIRQWDGLWCRDIYIVFIKIISCIKKLSGDTQTHRQPGDLIYLLSFYQYKKMLENQIWLQSRSGRGREKILIHPLILFKISSSVVLFGVWTLSIFLVLFKTAFRRLDSVSMIRRKLVRWAQSIELVPINRAQLSKFYVKSETGCVTFLRSNSIGLSWVSLTEGGRRRRNPVSETLCVLNKTRAIDNVQMSASELYRPSDRRL